MSKELEVLNYLNNTAFSGRDYDNWDEYCYLTLKDALKRLEKFEKWAEKLKEDDDYAIQYNGVHDKLELNELHDPQPSKRLDEWEYWSDEK